jgi:flagellar hook-length control protein FliK
VSAPASSVSGPPLVDQLAATIENAHRGGERSVRLRLQPEGLGEVTIRIELTSQGVGVRLSADRPATQELIQSNWQELSQALDQRGLAVAHLLVDLSGSGLPNGGQPARDSWQSGSARQGGAPTIERLEDEPLAGLSSAGGSRRLDYRV